MLFGIALLYALRIPLHLHASGAHELSLLRADIIAGLLFGGLGAVVLFTGRPDAGGVISKRSRGLSISLQGLFLIGIAISFNFRNLALFLGTETATATVTAVDHAAPLASGKTFYHLIYEYRDKSGVAHSGFDTVASTTPIRVSRPVQIIYAMYLPGISKVSSTVGVYGVFMLCLGLLYEIWGLYLMTRPVEQAALLANAIDDFSAVETTLHFPQAFTWFGWVIAVGGPVIVGILALKNPPSGSDWLIVCSVMVLPILLGAFVVRLTTAVRLQISPVGIRSQGLGGKEMFLAWGEIEKVRWGTNRRGISGFIFSAMDGRQIAVSAYLSGLATLVTAVRAHLEPSVYEAARPGIVFVEKMDQIRKKQAGL